MIQYGRSYQKLKETRHEKQCRKCRHQHARRELKHMTYPVRNAVRVVLLNDSDDLLLMCMDDPTITAIGEKYTCRFWTLIGGEIEPNETVRDAAAREVLEETGLAEADIEFGPQVWFGELDLILKGKPTHVRQEFIVARTRRRDISLANLTGDEKEVVKQVAWFSLDRIINSGEVIHPVLLPKYLPDIIAGKYTKEPLEIGLTTTSKK